MIELHRHIKQKIPQGAYNLCGISMLIANTPLYHVTQSSYAFVLVEPAVIETASEDLSPQLSTSVVYLLRFPSRTADKQAMHYGILLFMARVEKISCSRSLLIDASYRIAVIPTETGGLN